MAKSLERMIIFSSELLDFYIFRGDTPFNPEMI